MIDTAPGRQLDRLSRQSSGSILAGIVLGEHHTSGQKTNHVSHRPWYEAVTRWVLRVTGAQEVTAIRTTPIAVGAVAFAIERVDVDVRHSNGALETRALVVKRTWAHEVLGLHAAQAIRAETDVVPELIANGQEGTESWLVTPFFEGSNPSGTEVPVAIVEGLAHLHFHWLARWEALQGIPVIDSVWWTGMCLDYSLPQLDQLASRAPDPAIDRAREFLRAVARDDVAVRVLDGLQRTLLHGDVRTENILVDSTGAVLVDWGSARIGPAMLDLSNVARPGTGQFSAYSQSWEQLAGTPLEPTTIEQGYKWAALQNPVQALGWIAQHLGPRGLDQAVAHATEALHELRALDQRTL
jgi:fructosamine-3-kinase